VTESLSRVEGGGLGPRVGGFLGKKEGNLSSLVLKAKCEDTGGGSCPLRQSGRGRGVTASSWGRSDGDTLALNTNPESGHR